uniref:BMA-IGCM-3 n=1 Tax=Anisakis simplex TaxID=6269 RepID=A0A0M3JWS4_ANISI
LQLICSLLGQIAQNGIQVKISDMPFPVANAQQLSQIVWTMLGTTTKETIYCVSEAPVSQLRFVCVDCFQKNITDMVNVLSGAQDLTRSAGFPTVALRNVAVSTNWTGATIMCQAALNGGTIDSAQAVIDVRYLRQPHVVDASGQGPVLIANQGYRFYVECVRGSDGLCQQSARRKTLRCAVQSHPPATVFRWLKNGVVTSGNGADITIGTEMIGQSIQCSANNGLFSDNEMPTSQAVQIDPYSAARLIQDNFQTMQNAAPFQAGNRIDMNQQINLGCQVEGSPRPLVFWKLSKSNGQVVDAACAQGFDGQYQEVPLDQRTSQQPLANNLVRLNAVCSLRIANYSFSGQYWCSACSYVSQGIPECSPSLETPGPSVLSVQVQGPPMQSDAAPSVEKALNGESATVTVHYCAEPTPKPPRDVIFAVDQNELQIGQTWQNFRFEGTTQNNTLPNCFLARLHISSITEDDQSRQIVLKVQNTYGSKHISVPLGALLGEGTSTSSSVSGWVVALILVLAFGLVASVIVIFCVRRNLFCFDKVKSTSSPYDDKRKSNLNVRQMTYAEEIPRPLYAPPSAGQPAEVMRCESRTESAYQFYLSKEAVV